MSLFQKNNILFQPQTKYQLDCGVVSFFGFGTGNNNVVLGVRASEIPLSADKMTKNISPPQKKV